MFIASFQKQTQSVMCARTQLRVGSDSHGVKRICCRLQSNPMEVDKHLIPIPFIYHLISIMTSFLTFVPFRVNDLPRGIMGWLYGALVDRVISGDYHCQQTSDQSYLKALMLLWPLLTESETLRELDNNQTECTHQQPALHFQV